MTFGDLLKVFRERRKLTLRELGMLAGVDHGYIHALESDKKDNPSYAALTKLVKPLKLSGREVSVLMALLEYSAPDDLIDYVLQNGDADIADFKLLASMCPVEVEPQDAETWGRLLRDLSLIRREVESL